LIILGGYFYALAFTIFEPSFLDSVLDKFNDSHSNMIDKTVFDLAMVIGAVILMSLGYCFTFIHMNQE